MQMAKRNTTISVVLDRRTQTEDGLHPVKLRVTHNRANRMYSLRIYLSEDDFSKLNTTKKKSPSLKDAQVVCDNYLFEAREIIETIKNFSFDEFRERMFPTAKEEVKDYIYVEEIFKEKIEKLKSEGRVSTYQSYQTTLNSLLKFKPKLKWTDVTVDFLNKYEKEAINDGKSPSTVGIYGRTLRAAYKIAIDRKVVDIDSYPFGRRKYEIPASRNIKKALDKADMKKIVEYDCKGNNSEELARDIFVFSYVCNGLNIKDICLLKRKDIDGDILSFVRAKTSRTKKADLKPIQLHLNELALSIIAKYRNSGRTSFLFPFLEDELSPEDVRKRVQNLTKTVNKYMKRIGENLGLGDSIRTYTARHTYSTVLKRSGASLEYISESLGHSDLKTTENYLASFDSETKKKNSKLLIDFTK